MSLIRILPEGNILRRILLPALALLAGLVGTAPANAYDGFQNFPFGFGYYQPYGIRYRNSVPTPPYFAVNPPVYYGARHTRPYGVSPFASLPEIQTGSDYRSRPAVDFVVPPQSAPMMNPHCCASVVSEGPQLQHVVETPALVGPVRENPYAQSQLATKPDDAAH